ncbi:hypothetical protein BgiBS90_008107, partial [Biomphalaria glabrata]
MHKGTSFGYQSLRPNWCGGTRSIVYIEEEYKTCPLWHINMQVAGGVQRDERG